MKRILSILVVLAMLLIAISGCSNNDSGDANGAKPTISSEETTTNETAADETTTTKETTTDEPANTEVETAITDPGGELTFSGTATEFPAELPTDAGEDGMFGMQTTWNNYGLPTDPITVTANYGSLTGEQMDLCSRMIKKATGITIDWQPSDPTKFAALVAADNLPDIICLDTTIPSTVTDLISRGSLVNMAPYFEKYGKNQMAILDNVTADWLGVNYGGSDKGLYLIPNKVSNFGGYQAISSNGYLWMYTRYDIYRAVGMPALTGADGVFSDDLYLAAMEKMQASARQTLNDQNVYALSGFTDWGPAFLETMYIQGMHAEASQWTDIATGQPVAVSITDPSSKYWNWVRFYNRAYNMGILDPDSFTQTYEQYAAKIQAGQLLTDVFSWDIPTTEVKAAFGEDAGWFKLKGQPYIGNIYATDNPLGSQANGVSMSRAINSKCQCIDRVVAMFDYISSDEFMRLRTSGIYGLSWGYNADGVPVYNPAWVAAGRDSEWASKYLAAGGIYDANTLTDMMIGGLDKICADGYPNGISSIPANVAILASDNKAVQGFLGMYNTGQNIKYAGQLYAQWQQEGIATTNIVDPTLLFAPAQSPEIADTQAKVIQYINDNMAQWIMSKPDQVEGMITKAQTDVKNLGANDVYNDYVSRIQQSKDIAAGFGY